jgi:hypothetical protein
LETTKGVNIFPLKVLSALGAMTDSTADDGVSVIIHVIVVIKIKFGVAMRAVRIISHFFISFSFSTSIILSFSLGVKGV